MQACVVSGPQEECLVKIVPFRPDLASQIAALYNEAIAPVPDCHPVAQERFGSMEGIASRNLRDEALMAAAGEDGELLGFAHVGVSLPPTEDWQPPADQPVIRFLYYRAGARRAGQALLEWAEDWARERGDSIIAYHQHFRYPFYHAPYCHLSEHMGHVRALFGMNGYREDAMEVYLRWVDFTPPEPVRPDLDFELTREESECSFGSRVRYRAVQGGRTIGSCTMDRGHWSDPEGDLWCFCDGLGVEEEFQGKRLGMFLLCTGLKEMHRAGCRHASITTGWENHRAALMYTNMGYRHGDRTCSYQKELNTAKAQAKE